jgi:hypothetical protein
MQLLLAEQRRTVRAPVNPIDKSTVVSIFPMPLDDKKVTIQPGTFHVDAGSYENPAVCVVGPSSWWREIDEDQPLIEVVNSSIQVADSIVRDYINGMLGSDMGESRPGFFHLVGALTPEQVKKDYKDELDKAKVRQNNWYRTLVRVTDAMWARTNGNPLCISDHARLAADQLGLKSKEWMKDFLTYEQVRCIACGSFKNPEFPVCSTCKAITDPKKAKELGIVFAA